MQALKALVIFLGVLIFAGTGLLIYGLVTRGAGSGSAGLSSGTKAPPAAAAAVALAPFGDIEVPVPEGCGLAGSTLAGGHLMLRLDGQAERGCQQVVVVDLASGSVLGRVKAVPQGQ